MRTKRTHTIELEIRDPAQLYDSLDPAPFHDRALDPKFEAYLVESAREHPPGTVLTLSIRVPTEIASHAAEIETAIHAHFAHALAAAKRRDRYRLRAGHAAAAIGLALLAACVAIRGALPETGPLVDVFREGLLILGWVALWRPIDILLFERWELRNERRHLDQLARARVVFAEGKKGTEGINSS